MSHIILAFAPVLVVFVVQLAIWPMLRPFAWFLFIPAVFLSAWIGGRWLGILASVVATLFVWYFFLFAQGSFVLERQAAVIVSSTVFMGMGIVFSFFQGRLERTQRRVAELLADSRYQAQFEPVFQAIQDGIIVTDMEGAFILVNKAEARINGFPTVEAMKQTLAFYRALYELSYPDGKPLPFEEWPINKVLKGESITNFELRARRRDTGQEWLLSVSGEPVRNEQGKQILAVLGTRDITGQKRAEESLRASESQFKATFENVAVGIANVALDGRFMEVNQRLCEIVGYTREELLTKSFVDISHPDDVEEDWKRRRRLLQGEIENFSIEKRYGRKDGTTVWVNLTVSLMRKADGSPDYYISVHEDISARHQAEEKLRASELRFRTMVSAIPSPTYEGDRDGNNTFASDQWFAYTGMTAEETAGRGFIKAFHPDDRENVKARYEAAVRAGTLFESRLRIRAADGSYHWFLNRALPGRNAEGRIVRWAGSLTDIDDLIRAEERLRENELRFRTIISAVPSLIWEADAEGNNIFVSDQWLVYTGMTAKETTGSGFIESYHPDEAEDVLAQWSAAVQSGLSFESKCRIRAVDGSYRWFLNRAQPGRDTEGRIVRWAGSLTDIEDLIRIEQALRESKERLAGIVSTAMDAIITVDEDQRIVLFNEAAERMFGCMATEALGQTIERFIPGCFRYADSENIARLSSLNALRADGTEFPIEAAISKIEVGGRKLYTVIHRDITERKLAEAEHEKLVQEQLARAAAEAANRSKDEFLAMVSHELRSPLTAILGYTRMLRSGSGPVDRDTIDKVTTIVERSAKAQLRIIEDLLDSARIIAGKLRIESEPIDLVPVLEAALDTARPAAEAKGVELVADFGPEPEQMLGDSTRLQQVVWNLLSNAVKFTPKGGRVVLRMKGSSHHIRITVRDNGKGIEPELLPLIFDRFRQADSSSARRVGGLGLGLSLAKHLVDLHAGTITVASKGVGHGSTFAVTLPRRQLSFISRPTPAPMSREVRTEGALALDVALSLEGVNILVVDDQEEARVVLTQMLSEYGAHVTALPSGAEALGLLANPPGRRWPDILILDIAMPGEDGYTVLKKVRALEAKQGIEAGQLPAIALTAFGRSEDRLRALQAGFQMHVAKPVEPAELAVVIASLTNRRVWDRARKV